MITNPYRVAGEQEAQEILEAIVAKIEKRAGDLDMFQLESLLAILRGKMAELVLHSNDPQMPFLYKAMRGMLEQMLDRQRLGQVDHEQRDYSYGIPMMPEIEEQPEAFDFKF